MVERQALIVYFRNPKALKDIQRVGNVVYHHKKRKYAVVSVDKDDSESVMKKMRQNRQIKYVDWSYLDQSIYTIDFDVK
jgi:uncharacterized protein YlbG (UPF0298 family)